jgi:hypothetical protein
MEGMAIEHILKGTNPGIIPARWFGLIWFNGFRGKDLNVIFYQNMPRKISHKNPERMLNCSLPCSCS